ncbi:MAG: YedE family putative selenium transporter [Tepidanaerobacteraceae bacterium]|nr:YedE family putative selenium transporter [Tepidanaerobacteraceae bacterium]
MNEKKGIIITGAIVGILATVLVKLGNPVNMGLCIVCFIRDTAGGLGLHRAGVVQYIRPEIIGMALGAFIIALISGDYHVRGGSAPFTRFILGIFVVIGSLMFLGCPLRMILRLAGGDLNALLGLTGFAIGIFIGVLFLNKGFSLKRTYKMQKSEGYMFPAVQLLFLLLLLIKPAFIFFSKEGPGASYAPVAIALAAGLIIGIGAQKTRLCMVGGIRDMIMFRDSHLISGFIAVFITALIGSLLIGTFKLGFEAQPVAHADGLWNFLGMVLCGCGAVMLGGCPMRQIILGAEGNIDSVITVMGMYVGAAFSHNFGLAASVSGPSSNGQIAVIVGLVVVLIIGFMNTDRSAEVKMKGDVKLEI